MKKVDVIDTKYRDKLKFVTSFKSDFIKAHNNIKSIWKTTLRKSKHFPQLHRDMSYIHGYMNDFSENYYTGKEEKRLRELDILINKHIGE